MDATQRAAASAPALAVPIRSTALGATLGAYATLFPSGPDVLRPSLVLAAIFAAGTVALWVRQRRRCLSMSQPEASLGGGLGMRLARTSAFVLALGVGITAWSAYSMQTSVLPDRFGMMSHENADYGGGAEIEHGTAHGTAHDTAHSHGGDAEFARGHSHQHGHGHDGHSHGSGQATSVTALQEEDTGDPDRRFTLTAQKDRIRLSSGKTVEALDVRRQGPRPRVAGQAGRPGRGHPH